MRGAVEGWLGLRVSFVLLAPRSPFTSERRLTLPTLRHLIEPRFDEIKSENEKLEALGQAVTSEKEVSLKPFRAASGSTPVIAAGGYNAENYNEGMGSEHDLVAMGRYFCSNADLVDRLREGKPLYRYSESSAGLTRAKWPADVSCPRTADRARFYGP